MAYEKPAEFSDTSAWRTTDRAWVTRREEEWRTIHAVLADPRWCTLKPAELKALRDYFLTGRMDQLTSWRGKLLPSLLLFHRLWFHPDRSKKNWDLQVRLTSWRDYEYSIDEFRMSCDPKRMSLGGLEGRMYEALLGGAPQRSFLDLNAYQLGAREWKTKSILPFFGRPEELVDSLVCAFLNADMNLAFARAYTLPQLVAALRSPAQDRWSFLLDHPKRAKRIEELFKLIASGSYRRKSLKQGDASVHRDRDQLAREIVETLEAAPDAARARALWRKRGRPAPAGRPSRKPAARKPAVEKAAARKHSAKGPARKARKSQRSR